MKDLRIYPKIITLDKIKDEDLDEIVSFAIKKSPIYLHFIKTDNKIATVMFEITKKPKKYSRVIIDTYKSNFNITTKGQKDFVKCERILPDSNDRKEAFCGKRIMRIDVKKTGEGMILAYMLDFLKKEENLEEIKLNTESQ